MAEKGIVNNYTHIPTTIRDYYYDNETDKSLRKDIGDSFKNLVVVNNKLKKELEAGKSGTPKVEEPEEAKNSKAAKQREARPEGK